MNYIRTKNRIVDVNTIADVQTKVIYKDNFIAQADTIEELCDEFVLEDETLPPHLKKDLKELCRYKIYIAGSRGVIYGAIWTDKGLIYVAKMNNEGVLELL